MDSRGLGILALALAASPRPQEGPGKEALLARVPPGLEIAADRVSRSARGGFRARSSIAWSEDGSTVAYAARRSDVAWLPVVGAKVGEAFVFVSPPVLAGGRVFFHVVRDVRPNEQHHALWADGKKVGPEDWMGDIAVRPDGRQVAFCTQPGAKVGAGSEPVMDPKNLFGVGTFTGVSWTYARGEKWFDADSMAPIYSGDGRRAFTRALERGKGWLILEVGKREVPRCDPSPTIDSFAVSADGAALAFVRMNPPRPDSPVFPTAEDGAERYFKGKRVGGGHAVVSMPAVDPRGAHVAYVVTKDGRRAVAIDEEKYAGPGYDFVFDLVFDPTGERLAYGARDASGWRVVCGEARSAAHPDVGTPFFAADGRSIGFGSRDDRELWWRVLVP